MLLFLQLFEAEIADLYLCLGNAYTLEAELLKPMEYFEKALEFYRSQGKRYILRQIQACIQLGKAYRLGVKDVVKCSQHC